MSDQSNQILIGIKTDTTETRSAMDVLTSSISKISTNLDGMTSKFNQAFGQNSLSSISSLSQSLDRLSSLLSRITGQTQTLAKSMGDVASGGATLGESRYVDPVYGGGAAGGGAGSGGPPPPNRPMVDPVSGQYYPQAPTQETPQERNSRIAKTMGVVGSVTAAAGMFGPQLYDLSERYSVAKRQVETFGLSQALGGDVTSYMAGKSLTTSDRVRAMAGAVLPGLGQLIGGAAVAFGTGGVGSLIGGGVALNGVRSLVNSPVAYNQELQKLQELELAQTPQFNEAARLTRSAFARPFRGVEQAFGQGTALEMFRGSSQFGAEEGAAFAASVRQYGVSNITDARYTTAANMRAKVMQGMGGFVEGTMKTGHLASPEALSRMRGNAVGAGLGDFEDIGLRENLFNIASSMQSNSGLMFRGAGDVNDYQSQVLGFGGRAKSMGLGGEEALSAAGGAMQRRDALPKNELFQSLIRERLAQSGIVGFEASALINAGAFGANRERARGFLSQRGMSEDQISSLLTMPETMMGKMQQNIGVSNEFEASFKESFGTSARSQAITGNQRSAASQDLLLAGELRGGKGEFQTRTTTEDEIRKAESARLDGVAEFVDKAGNSFINLINQAAVEFKQKLTEDLGKRNISAPVPNTSPQGTAGRNGK